MKKKETVSKGRRKFVKQLSSGALATAAAAVPAIASAAQRAPTEWSSAYDWICVGSGASGCTAAIAGHDHGMKTVLLEKDAMIGGITSESAGMIWAPLNPFMKAAGMKDSREEALAYLEYTGGGEAYTRREYMEHYVDNAPRAIEYLHQKADVKFRLCELVEFYYPESPGSKQHGRELIYEPFPAETLGAWRNKVKISPFYHGLSGALEGLEHNPSMGGLLKGGSDGPHIGHAGPIRGDEKRLALWRKWLGPKIEPMLKKDEEHRVAGAALVAYLFRAVLQRGIEVRTETNVAKLRVEDGRVVGVTVHHNGKEENIRANRGVLLGTGGGNGLHLAAEAGADLDTEAELPGLNLSFRTGEKRPDGRPVARANYEQRMRHSMVVNRFGQRFGNEVSYNGLASMNQFDVHGTHRFIHIPFYFLFDSQLLEKYSFAGLPPGNKELLDWVARATTVAELAQKLKIPADRLEATVARFNQFVAQRKDADFGRSPVTLGRLEKPPYYGFQVEPEPDPLRHEITVVVNLNSQVIHYETKKPIPGLYAVGPRAWIETDQIWGIGYQAGFDLMYITMSGLLAAEHAAATSV